jgi:hypothetical protein
MPRGRGDKTDGLPKKAIGLVFILFPSLSTVLPTNIDAMLECTADEGF